MNAFAYSEFRSAGFDRVERIARDVLYSHGNIKVSTDAITIKCYYMPTGASKVIRFWDIVKVEEADLSFWTSKGWGAGSDCKTWWHWDYCFRGISKKRRRGILLHTNSSSFIAGISPRDRDYDTVLALIRQRIAVETRKLVDPPYESRKHCSKPLPTLSEEQVSAQDNRALLRARATDSKH